MIIYYKYDQKYEHCFPFKVSNLRYDKDYICSKINNRTDDFTNIVTISSMEFINGDISPITLHKYIDKNKITFSLYLRTIGSVVSVNGIGATIIFDDGTKWYKPSKIDVDSNENGFIYSTYINLTLSDLNLFKNKKVKKFRLYIFDQKISDGISDIFNLEVRCILNK